MLPLYLSWLSYTVPTVVPLYRSYAVPLLPILCRTPLYRTPIYLSYTAPLYTYLIPHPYIPLLYRTPICLSYTVPLYTYLIPYPYAYVLSDAAPKPRKYLKSYYTYNMFFVVYTYFSYLHLLGQVEYRAYRSHTLGAMYPHLTPMM